MQHGFWTETSFLTLSAVIIDGFAGLAGGLLPERWLANHQRTLTSFASGALIGAVFLDILPEAFESAGVDAMAWALGGFVVCAGIHLISESKTMPGGLLASDALHNIGDGAAVAAAFMVSIRSGIAVSLAIIAHEVPQEVSDYVLLRAAGWGRRKALLGLLCVQFTALLGALTVILAEDHFHSIMVTVLAVAAGSFLYIGGASLLTSVYEAGISEGRTKLIFGFLAGFGIVMLLLFM